MLETKQSASPALLPSSMNFGLIPSFIKGIYKSIKYKDFVLLAEPVVAVLTTDIILYNFLKLPDGRRFIIKSFSWIFRKPYEV